MSIIERPAVLPLNPEGIPQSLRAHTRFVGFSLEPDGRGGWTKTPRIPTDPARKASSTDSATWRTFEEARAAVESGRCDVLGFALGKNGHASPADRLVGFDFDKCIDDAGNIDPRVLDFIARLDTYTERSPSGRGIRAFARADGIPATGRKRGPYEIYNAARFLTITGHRLPGTPSEPQERTEQVAAVHKDIFGTVADSSDDARPSFIDPDDTTGKDDIDARDMRQSVSHLSDDELIALATRAANGGKLQALLRGDTTGYPSHSEADLALCCMLAFWTQGDDARIDRIFRNSGLMRAKWDHNKGASTYGARTIARAIERTDEFYSPSPRALSFDAPPADDSPRVVADAPYSFVSAFAPEHFVGKYLAHFSKQCDAAHEYHEAAALVALSAATHNLRARISGSADGLRTNLFLLFLGDAGRSRKSTSKDYCVQLVRQALPDKLLPEQMTQEALVESLTLCNGGPALWAIDEFTDALSKMLTATYMAGFRGLLLELYSRTSYTYRRVSKRMKKKKDDDAPAEREEDMFCVSDVTLSVLGCATPTLFAALDSSAVGSGLLTRFAIVWPQSKPPRLPQFELHEDPIPSPLVKQLHDISVRTATQAVMFAPGVLARIDEAIDAPLDESAERCQMTVRMGVMARKVAMLSAAGRPHHDDALSLPLAVTLQDAESAIRVVKRWIDYAEAFEARIDESAFELKVQRCVAVVKGHTVNRRVIAQRVHVPAKELLEIEKTLEQRGQIEVIEHRPPTGRPSVSWRWTS